MNKIAVFYGHVASNIGDLAINVGELAIIRRIYPDASVTFVALHVQEGPKYEQAKSEVAVVGKADWMIYRTSFRHALVYQADPARFLKDCDLEDVDLVLLASGEHLFSYEDQQNLRSLYWRTLPALSAKALKKPCFLMPSTLGPFSSAESKRWVHNFLRILDGVAVRDRASYSYLKKEFDFEAELLPDPAFFLQPKIHRSTKNKVTTLGISMRAEDWGIRLSEKQRHTSSDDKDIIKASPIAVAFTSAVVENFLNFEPNGKVVLFVQTDADRGIAEQVLREIKSDAIVVSEPSSISDYLDALSSVDALVASRFHAIIMALKVGTPVRGVYFSVHGHKMPGLFSWLNLEDACHSLDGDVRLLGEHIAADIMDCDVDWNKVEIHIEKECDTLLNWLRDSLNSAAETPLISAETVLAINDLSVELVRQGFEQDKIATVKKNKNIYKKEKISLIGKHESEIQEIQKKLLEIQKDKGFIFSKKLHSDELENIVEAHPEHSIGLDFSLPEKRNKG